jgi:DNA-directed RNA polymerase subunit RPC12/RpoP
MKIGYKCESCNKIVEDDLQEHHWNDKIYCTFCRTQIFQNLFNNFHLECKRHYQENKDN